MNLVLSADSNRIALGTSALCAAAQKATMQKPSTKPNTQPISPPPRLHCPCCRLLVGKPGGYKTSAHLNDGKDIGKDLSGGFYDAGGELVKPCLFSSPSIVHIWQHADI